MEKAKVILITGGGSGIGRTVALRFAASGYPVAICGRNQAPLEQTAAEARKAGWCLKPFQVDVTDVAAVTELVAAVGHSLGRISVLVNSAGQSLAKPILETSVEEWRNLLEVNLLGTVNCCKAVLPTMMQVQEGVIINISSTLGKKGIGSMAAYCASKFGVIAFTQSLAEETRPYGIRVHAICPGATDTPLHRGVVGQELACLAMHPDRVAKMIFAVADGSLKLPSGGDVVIDGEPESGLLSRLSDALRGAVSRVRREL